MEQARGARGHQVVAHRPRARTFAEQRHAVDVAAKRSAVALNPLRRVKTRGETALQTPGQIWRSRQTVATVVA